VALYNGTVKVRLDNLLAARGLAASRSQAENYIALGKVLLSRDGKNWQVAKKSGAFVDEQIFAKIDVAEQFVSRAALKLQSVAEKLGLDFRGKIVLDIGSSTGGFTEFALTRGARKVIAVDVGTDQLSPKLRRGKFAKQIELHEKTDIRDFCLPVAAASRNVFSSSNSEKISEKSFAKAADFPDIILADVSFISLREILPHVAKHLANAQTQIVAMVKPQFETGARAKNRGVVKNDTERREILRDFELWARKYFVIIAKKDSEVAGANGNRERFYLLKCAKMK